MHERMLEALQEAAEAIIFWFLYALLFIPVCVYILVRKEERTKFLDYINGRE